jgi:hypothetical protein
MFCTEGDFLSIGIEPVSQGLVPNEEDQHDGIVYVSEHEAAEGDSQPEPPAGVKKRISGELSRSSVSEESRVRARFASCY